MKISVDHDFVPGRFQGAQPGNELSILHRRALMVVIRNNQQRAMANSFLVQFRNDLANDRLRRGRDVVNRDYQKILSRARCRDNRAQIVCDYYSAKRAKFPSQSLLSRGMYFARGARRPLCARIP